MAYLALHFPLPYTCSIFQYPALSFCLRNVLHSVIVAGLRTLASQLNATYADLRVVLTAPDGGTSLAEQVH